MNERERLVGLWRAARILDELESLERREPIVRANRSVLLSKVAQYNISFGVDLDGVDHRQWSLRYALENALADLLGMQEHLSRMFFLLDDDFDPTQADGGRAEYVIDPGASD